MARRLRWWLLLLEALHGAACTREPDPPQPQAERPQLPFAAGKVASAAAFDLINQRGAVFLAFAPLRAQGGTVVLRRLDRFGHARGATQQLVAAAPASEVVELALTATGAQLALGFTEHDPSGLHTRALLFTPGDEPPAPELLSHAALSLPRGRGHIAVAAAGDGRARLLYLTREAECLDQSLAGPCFGFAFRELGPGARGPRDGEWLSVPQPCSEGAATLAARPGHFYYAICSAAQEPPVTTAYAISIDPEYARADAVLRGCTPLGFTQIDADTLLLGAECSGVRRVARLGPATQPPAEFPLVDAALTCQGDRMRLQALGFALAFDAPQDGVEAVLPAAIAPTGSRAVFTGRALLVAQRMSEQLVLRSYVCDAGRLRISSSADSPRYPTNAP